MAVRQDDRARAVEGLTRRRLQVTTGFVVVLLSGASTLESAQGPTTIVVEPSGRERASSGAGPSVSTLQAAIDLAGRQHRTDPRRAIVIALAPGIHRFDQPARFRAGQGGTAEAPLVVRGAADGSTRIVGSVRLEPSPGGIPPDLLRRLPVEARAQVRAYRLPAALTATARIQEPRLLKSRDAPLAFEVYDAQGALWPARWPNQGWGKVASDATSDPQQPRFIPEGDRAERWRGETDLWAEGYWRWNWLFETLPVTIVEAGSKRLVLGERPFDGIAAGARFRIVHALSELDEPGEWWRDPGWGLLLVWPRDPSGFVEASVTDGLIDVADASHIRFESLNLEQAHGTLVRVTRASDVVVSRSVLTRAGGHALVVEDSTASGIERSDITQIGAGGIRITGGDRATLTPGRLFVRDCRLSDYARLARTQSPAIAVDGVGQTVEGNFIHDTDEYALHLRGNDHRVAWNEIAYLLSGSTDSGAIYAGRDWTARGTTIEHNFLHDIRAAPSFEVKGLYLDDMASGFAIRANLFLRVDQPVFIGGGRDNAVTDNLFVRSSPAIHIDSRGQTWAKDSIDDPESELRGALVAVPTGSPLWRTRYPSLARILTERPAIALHNTIVANTFFDSEPFRYTDGARAEDQVIARNLGPEGLRVSVPDGESDPAAFATMTGAGSSAGSWADTARMWRSKVLKRPFAP
ncbi:right-handed parallel beta-helix repeat-containing protein [Methylobacterium sp. BTF04]|uniref:right-handed parallel beta-helix repeat-containing protein n=1 Tax=Methylobacterium sp. BTF04 TaxID=2708300 RepID=UPI0013D21CAA|nr:right-handed parallel beta-helix repeat-containing protein [Methylobacterium sp. BTF04]NEU13894.1 right-handed parallel beta-helix repeat-containing protein [Methylobacterium sp. BTF04]